MNLFKAWEARASLNEKMILLLLQGLRDQRDAYIHATANYTEERMASHGQPFLDALDAKILAVTEIISTKFNKRG